VRRQTHAAVYFKAVTYGSKGFYKHGADIFFAAHWQVDTKTSPGCLKWRMIGAGKTL